LEKSDVLKDIDEEKALKLLDDLLTVRNVAQ